MDFSAEDLKRLKMLHDFLTTSFKGASFGSVKIDDCVESLGKSFAILTNNQTKESKSL